MKKLSTMVRTVICLLVVTGALSSFAPIRSQRLIREVSTNRHANKRAPAACLAVFRAFFRYVQKREPSILSDEPAQKRWLSRLMRLSLASHIKRSGSPQENPDYPSNGSFVGVWNMPTTFSIIGSRHYDYRNSDNRDDNRVVIDVLYEWGKSNGVDNQYPGEKSLRSFIFVREDGLWKLDDIYTFSDEFARPGSLRSYFEKQ